MKVVVLVIEAVTCRFCFFFRQKTAYERRISDWSSDVCSSDLRRGRLPGERERAFGAVDRDHFGGAGQCRLHGKAPGEGVAVEHARVPGERRRPGAVRPGERRVGTASVRTFTSRLSPSHETQKDTSHIHVT